MVTMTKNISVVIPLYNKESYIKRAIHSILSQTHQHFDIIVVNDGSTDDGLAKAKGIKDKRIRIFNQENSGVSAARNKGIDEAKNDLIAFLDADDQWEPEFLENCIRIAEVYPDAGMVGTAYKIINPKGKLIYPDFKYIPPKEGYIENYFKAALIGNPINSSNVAVRKKVFKKLGGFNIGMRYGEDGLMWSKIALSYPVAFINKFISVRYENTENRVSKQYEVVDNFPLFDYIRTIDLKVKEEEYYYLKEYVYQKYLLIAGRYLRIGDKINAEYYLNEAKDTKICRQMYLLGKIALYLPKPAFKFLASIWGKLNY